MNRFVKTLVAVGVAMVVVRLVKGRPRSVAGAGPDITITGGEGLSLEVSVGSFVSTGSDWYHEHTAGEPRTLFVTAPGGSCTFLEDNRVDIHTSHGTLVIQRERPAPGGAWAAYVRATNGSQPEQAGSGRLVFWPGQHVTIDEVEVGDRTCPRPMVVAVAQPT